MAPDRRRAAADPERTPLTPRAVVEAALALADSEGLPAVTIRRLARELRVTPMALYWHFRTKDELLDGMVDRLHDEIDPAVPGAAPWPEQLRALLTSIVDVLRAHPAVAPLVSTRSTASASSLRTTETLLEILRRGGFSPAEATQVARHALSTLTHLVAEVAGPGLPEETAEQRETRRQARVFLGSLPPDRYPRLVEAAEPLSECEDPEGYFAFGLDLLLAGIEAMARRG
ncbi:TetR/AcrR family transcriptional regulator [Prauserella shujinwangii]|nr:TetR/AcrR family transcriptional regulator [Prauserella shujinwangii]